MTKAQDNVKDFDKILPPARTAILGGEEIVFAKVSTRESLQLADVVEKLTEEGAGSLDTIEGVAGALAAICSKRNEKFTADFILDNTTGDTLRGFLRYITGQDEDESKEGNEEAAQDQ